MPSASTVLRVTPVTRYWRGAKYSTSDPRLRPQNHTYDKVDVNLHVNLHR